MSAALTDIATTESRWTIFLQAIMYIMPEDAIDDMDQYHRHRPDRRRALWYAKDIRALKPGCGY
eukprot:5540497-Karenia_brevis.AAC.1